MASTVAKKHGPPSTVLGRVRALVSGLFSLLLGVIFVPLFLLLWLIFTITGIGPVAQYFFTRRDKALLDATIKSSTSSSEAVVEKMKLPGTSRALAVRWSPGNDASLPPVCIPNGLGATLITIASLHDELEARGYPVLSYDRAGVGQSDAAPQSWGSHATSEHVVQDMKAIMDMHVPIGGVRPWILVGPSMGTIVSQCYIARHPEDVAGLLNVDGFPFPFAAKRAKFLQAGKVYQFASSVVWTGLMRFFIGMAGSFLKKLASAHFKADVIQAQMNEANFTSSLSKEMVTMMDLAETAQQAWGPAFDIAGLEEKEREALINARPSACGDVISAERDYKWEELPRAAVEIGDDWAPAAETKAVVDALYCRAGGSDKQEPVAVLPRVWPRLVVRVMSARKYDFGAASDFYDDDMKAWAAAEHSLHANLAKDGKRVVFPTRSHDNMFFGLAHVMAAMVNEITAGICQAKGFEPPALSSPAHSAAAAAASGPERL